MGGTTTTTDNNNSSPIPNRFGRVGSQGSFGSSNGSRSRRRRIRRAGRYRTKRGCRQRGHRQPAQARLLGGQRTREAFTQVSYNLAPSFQVHQRFHRGVPSRDPSRREPTPITVVDEMTMEGEKSADGGIHSLRLHNSSAGGGPQSNIMSRIPGTNAYYVVLEVEEGEDEFEACVAATHGKIPHMGGTGGWKMTAFSNKDSPIDGWNSSRRIHPSEVTQSSWEPSTTPSPPPPWEVLCRRPFWAPY
ncbi:hypothetical protein B0T10DRAFT_561381 [Thelonectria olida]|uniref:Uncharacterized protein n=1 Tax=Thelonectria olida TaxID=1576542 RepID=A0A9P8W5I3_9HYPO|nr:hypothetical protein B0T10DRAFT_561381 [Thelonectria olida]